MQPCPMRTMQAMPGRMQPCNPARTSASQHKTHLHCTSPPVQLYRLRAIAHACVGDFQGSAGERADRTTGRLPVACSMQSCILVSVEQHEHKLRRFMISHPGGSVSHHKHLCIGASTGSDLHSFMIHASILVHRAQPTQTR